MKECLETASKRNPKKSEPLPGKKWPKSDFGLKGIFERINHASQKKSFNPIAT